MAKKRSEKEKILEEFSQVLSESLGVAVFDYQGLTSKEMFELRKKLREEKCALKVAKISLLKLATEKNNIVASLDFKRPIAIAYSKEDEILPFKSVANILKQLGKGEILSGFLGREYLAPETALRLSQLPTRKDLQSQLVSLIGAPIRNILFVFKANQLSLLQILNAYKNKLAS